MFINYEDQEKGCWQEVQQDIEVPSLGSSNLQCQNSKKTVQLNDDEDQLLDILDDDENLQFSELDDILFDQNITDQLDGLIDLDYQRVAETLTPNNQNKQM